MLTKSVNFRGTAATRTGSVRHGMGHKTPFSGRDSRKAAKDLRPNILQLNTEGLTADKISVIEQLANKNKAFIIVLQATHCSSADKLVIPNFSLAGSILSRNHGLATFVHERLEWSLGDQSPEQSETEWLCVDIAGYKIVNVYNPPRSRLTPTTIPTFPHTRHKEGDQWLPQQLIPAHLKTIRSNIPLDMTNDKKDYVPRNETRKMTHRFGLHLPRWKSLTT